MSRRKTLTMAEEKQLSLVLSSEYGDVKSISVERRRKSYRYRAVTQESIISFPYRHLDDVLNYDFTHVSRSWKDVN
jgi:hypothetical protein